jgi:hypothetical protein
MTKLRPLLTLTAMILALGGRLVPAAAQTHIHKHVDQPICCAPTPATRPNQIQTKADALSELPGGWRYRPKRTDGTIHQLDSSLPVPPKLATLPPNPAAPTTRGSSQYCNSFQCIPAAAANPARQGFAYNPEALSRTLTPRAGNGSVKQGMKLK